MFSEVKKKKVYAYIRFVQPMCMAVCILTDETVHILRVARVVWDSETSIADCHLALPKGKSEVTEFVEQTAHGLHRQEY